MDVDRGRVAGSHRQFEVLVVCTANLCRSPMLQALIADTLSTSPASWSVASAGTQAREGREVHPSTAQALAERGLALPDGWRTRMLHPDDVERSDLVLTASRSHRGEVVRLAPRASARTFTVRQFLRLLTTPGVDPVAGPGPDDVAEATDHGHPGDRMLETALAARGLGPPVHPERDDIADPVGRPYPVFRDLAATLAQELGVLTAPAASIRRSPTPDPAPTRRPTGWRSAPWWASRST